MANYQKIIEKIEAKLKNQPTLKLSSLKPKNSALFVVDMTRGFTREGILSSPRVENIIDNIKVIVADCKEKGIEVVYFKDSHSENSPEVNRLGQHCLQETGESEIVDELKGLEDELIKKNSTNGFLSDKFQKWLNKKKDSIENYIITGCVTDICVYNLATTLRAYFDRENNQQAEIYVPQNCVETYDVDVHDANLMNTVFLYGMLNYGIKVIKSFI